MGVGQIGTLYIVDKLHRKPHSVYVGARAHTRYYHVGILEHAAYFMWGEDSLKSAAGLLGIFRSRRLDKKSEGERGGEHSTERWEGGKGDSHG